MRVETLVLLALAKLRHERGTELGYRRDVVQVLEQLEASGVSLANMRFRPTPAGPHSDDLAEFIGRLAMGGYLRQESPIKLTTYGVDLIESHLRDRVRESNTDVVEALGLLGIADQYSAHQAATHA